MIQAAIEKILTLNENKIHEINGQYYSEKDLKCVTYIRRRKSPN